MELTLGWIALPVGIALGLLPPRWFYSDDCRHLTLVEARSSRIRRAGSVSTNSRRRRRWWKTPLVWLDPFRGYACGHLSALGLFEIPQNNPGQTALVLLLQCAIVAGTLIVQMEAGRQSKGSLLAPVFFLLGLTTGLYIDFGIIGAAVALLGAATMLATHSFTWGYVVAGAAAAAIGFPFLGPSPALVVFAATACAPAPYAFLRKADLVFPLRG